MLYREFLETLTECPFCTEKNRIILDAETAYLTYAIAPYHKHHLLILPKRHVESAEELTEQEEKDIEHLERTGMKALRKLGYSSITLLEREGKLYVNKSIAHTHYHLIPDSPIGDVEHSEESKRVLTEEEIKETVSEVKSSL